MSISVFKGALLLKQKKHDPGCTFCAILSSTAFNLWLESYNWVQEQE